MRKSLIITVVIVLLCLCGCEAVVTVPESPELTRASEMLLTTTAAEESTDKLEATTTSSVEIDVPEKNEEESGTPTEDVVSVDNKADLAEKNGPVSSESTVPSFEEVKADIWWGIAAWPVDGFIAANDFTGKTVIPFCTSSSSGLGESGELLEQAAGTGNWLEDMRFSSSVSEADVQTWIDNLEP